MKSGRYVLLAVSLLALTLSASAREMVLPAGTLLKCTLNEPNLSSATIAVGDPVLCHLHSVTEFGQQAFPRGSYLVGHQGQYETDVRSDRHAQWRHAAGR